MTKNKKILLVGSLGYLGSKLSDYLTELDYECEGIDTGYFQYGVIYYPTLIKTKFKDAKEISEEDIAGFDIVLMLAGVSNDPFGKLSYEEIYDPTRHYAISIAKICKKLGVRYIFPSSCSVYGDGGDGSYLNEESPTNPLTPYSLNKLQIEQDLEELADDSFSPIALRFGTVFGISPRIRFDVVINMLCGMAISESKIILNSDGQAWRPHIYIDDVCESFRRCIDWDYNGGRLMIFNVGSDENNYKILDIAKIISSAIPSSELIIAAKTENLDDLVKDRKIQDGVDKRTYKVNFDKIHNLLPNYKTNWTVPSGIQCLIEDLKKYNLSLTKFRQRDFYRLQQMEFLHDTGQLYFDKKFSLSN